jgi:hypothetical protein
VHSIEWAIPYNHVKPDGANTRVAIISYGFQRTGEKS